MKSWNNLKQNVDNGQILRLTVYGIDIREPFYVYLSCSFMHVYVGNGCCYSEGKSNFLFDITDVIKKTDFKSDEQVLVEVLTSPGKDVIFERCEIEVV